MVMALAKGMCYINDLPDELFAMILDLVPIKNVFADMRVSKRWEAACRYIIRTRQSVVIGDDNCYQRHADRMRAKNWQRDRPSEQLDYIALASESLGPLLMKSLNLMENVTRLCVSGMTTENVCPFIRKFADQLTMLEVDFPISDIGADVFPHLMQLHCQTFDAKTASAFPKLDELLIEPPMQHEDAAAHEAAQSEKNVVFRIS